MQRQFEAQDHEEEEKAAAEGFRADLLPHNRAQPHSDESGKDSQQRQAEVVKPERARTIRIAAAATGDTAVPSGPMAPVGRPFPVTPLTTPAPRNVARSRQVNPMVRVFMQGISSPTGIGTMRFFRYYLRIVRR